MKSFFLSRGFCRKPCPHSQGWGKPRKAPPSLLVRAVWCRNRYAAWLWHPNWFWKHTGTMAVSQILPPPRCLSLQKADSLLKVFFFSCSSNFFWRGKISLMFRTGSQPQPICPLQKEDWAQHADFYSGMELTNNSLVLPGASSDMKQIETSSDFQCHGAESKVQ